MDNVLSRGILTSEEKLVATEKRDEQRKREEGSTQTLTSLSRIRHCSSAVTAHCARNFDCVPSFLLQLKLRCSSRGSETLSVHVLNYREFILIRLFFLDLDKMTAAGFEKNQRQVSLGDTHQAMPVSLECCNTAHSNQGEISSPFHGQGLKNKTISCVLRKTAPADWLRRLPLYFRRTDQHQDQSFNTVKIKPVV